MQRVSVIGISGSGKTTLARHIAAHLDAPHIELDGIFHQRDWSPLPTEEFRARVATHVAGERWVIDGNYNSRVRDLVWNAADTIVWPDLRRRVVFPRLVGRTMRRMWSREELWNGNRERWGNLFLPLPERNILLWMWGAHRPQRRRTERQLEEAPWSSLALHRLRTPEAVQAFLGSL